MKVNGLAGRSVRISCSNPSSALANSPPNTTSSPMVMPMVCRCRIPSSLRDSRLSPRVTQRTPSARPSNCPAPARATPANRRGGASTIGVSSSAAMMQIATIHPASRIAATAHSSTTTAAPATRVGRRFLPAATSGPDIMPMPVIARPMPTPSAWNAPKPPKTATAAPRRRTVRGAPASSGGHQEWCGGTCGGAAENGSAALGAVGSRLCVFVGGMRVRVR